MANGCALFILTVVAVVVALFGLVPAWIFQSWSSVTSTTTISGYYTAQATMSFGPVSATSMIPHFRPLTTSDAPDAR